MNTAILYYNIGEFNTALEWIQRFIQVDKSNANAFKLLGQCYEKLKRPEDQLLAYQRSMELDKRQTDLLVESCKIHQNIINIAATQLPLTSEHEQLICQMMDALNIMRNDLSEVRNCVENIERRLQNKHRNVSRIQTMD